MAERYDLKVARTDKNGKTWWTKIGVMFPMRERDGFNMTFEALPIPSMNQEGNLECRVTAWEPYKEGEKPGNSVNRKAEAAQPTAAPAPPAGGDDLLDDNIPF